MSGCSLPSIIACFPVKSSFPWCIVLLHAFSLLCDGLLCSGYFHLQLIGLYLLICVWERSQPLQKIKSVCKITAGLVKHAH